MEKIFLMVKEIFFIPGFVYFLVASSLISITLSILVILLGRKSIDELWAKVVLVPVVLVITLLFLKYALVSCRFILVFVYKFVSAAEQPIYSMQAAQQATSISTFLVFMFFIILIALPLLILFFGPIFMFLLREFQGRCMYERGVKLIEEGKADAAKKIITNYEEENIKLSKIDRWLGLPTGLRLLKNKLEMSI